MNCTIEKLTSEEIKILRKVIVRAYITGTLAGIMISFLFVIAMFAKYSMLQTRDFYFTLMIISIAVFITSLSVKNLHSDIYMGVKFLFKYIIIQKLSYPDNEPGLGGEKMKYYLISEEKRFMVSEEQYSNAKINDLLIEHESPKSGISLKMVVINQ
jgi:uncharacterized membrane protein